MKEIADLSDRELGASFRSIDEAPAKTEQLLRVATLYYDEGLSQKEISGQLSLSSATVSRLLVQARKCGLVRIEICPPPNLQLGKELEKKFSAFGIRRILVSPRGRKPVGQTAARYFEHLAVRGDTVVLDGGWTIREFVSALTPGKLDGITIVPIASDPPSYEISAYQSMIEMALKYPLEVRMEKPPTPTAIKYLRPQVRRVQKAAKHARFVVLGTGPWACDYTALEFTKHIGFDSKDLKRRYKAVSAVTGYIPLDSEGVPIELTEIRNGMLHSLQVQDLRRLAADRRRSIMLLAHSKQKALAVEAVIRARLCNTLVMDEDLATALLDIEMSATSPSSARQ